MIDRTRRARDQAARVYDAKPPEGLPQPGAVRIDRLTGERVTVIEVGVLEAAVSWVVVVRTAGGRVMVYGAAAWVRRLAGNGGGPRFVPESAGRSKPKPVG